MNIDLREKLLQLNGKITEQEEQAENIDRFIGREQQIDISYNLVGIFPAALLNDLQSGKTA